LREIAIEGALNRELFIAARNILARRSATSTGLTSSATNRGPKKLGEAHLGHGLDLGVGAAVESRPGVLRSSLITVNSPLDRAAQDPRRDRD
jgi:hypothetical protein